MRKRLSWQILFLSAALGSFAAPALANTPSHAVASRTVVDSQVRTIIIPIKGMTCTHCSQHIHQTLSGMDGVVTNQVDLKHQTAMIRFDKRKLSDRKLVSAIDDLGYKAGKPHSTR